MFSFLFQICLVDAASFCSRYYIRWDYNIGAFFVCCVVWGPSERRGQSAENNHIFLYSVKNLKLYVISVTRIVKSIQNSLYLH